MCWPRVRFVRRAGPISFSTADRSCTYFWLRRSRSSWTGDQQAARWGNPAGRLSFESHYAICGARLNNMHESLGVKGLVASTMPLLHLSCAEISRTRIVILGGFRAVAAADECLTQRRYVRYINGAQTMLDSRKGKTVRLLRCQCGESIWDD
jgi:hypothetical protein